MQGIVVFAGVYFAAAIVSVAAAFSYGAPMLFGAALTSALGGILLLAVDRALVRLTEIRDALRGPQELDGHELPQQGDITSSRDDLRSEIDRKLDEARAKNWR